MSSLGEFSQCSGEGSDRFVSATSTRRAWVSGLLLGLGAVGLGLAGGCGDSDGPVVADEEAKKSQQVGQDKMREFMAKKNQPKKS